MADQVAENKRNAVAFYDLMFNQGKPAEAVEECREQGFFRDGHVKSNFLCNIGYSDRAKLSLRNPRLEFLEACTLW
jgi:hypothetical protein